MSEEVSLRVDEPAQAIDFRSQLILVALTLLVFLPFLNRAFNIDEPLFIWTAQQIQWKPLDFYGFPVNWYGTTMWIAEVMKNPPLASYYIAGVSAIFGFSEPVLHAAFLVPVVALVLGAYRLALSITERPLLAGLLSLFSPVLLICASSVMCDVMMLALWVWAIHLWMRGLRENRGALLLMASALAALSALTKYFGISLIPLMIVVGFAQKRRAGWWLLSLLIPVAVLGLYQLWTKQLYGRGLLFDAAEYATKFGWHGGGRRFASLVTGLSFTGGACIGMAPFLAYTARRGGWITWGTILIVALALLLVLDPYEHHRFRNEGGFAAWYFIQMALFTAAGLGVILAAGAELRRWRSPESLLLALWILGTFVFAALLNWSVNGRSIVPLVPAAAMLVARRMDQKTTRRLGWERTALVPAALLALLCTWADGSFANTHRWAARQLAERGARYRTTIYINGHWGFQYYLQLAGGRPLDKKNFAGNRGDMIATALNNTNVGVFEWPPDSVEVLDHLSRVPFPFIGTMRMRIHAGFYSDVFGPLPFALGQVPPDEFELIMLTMPDLPDPPPVQRDKN